MGLNPKQQRFCEEYLISLNATQAAVKAGYSEKTAGSQGSRLLKDISIREYIRGRQRETFLENALTQVDVLSRLSNIVAGRVPEIKEVVTTKAEYIPNGYDSKGQKMIMVYNKCPEVIPLPTNNSDRNKPLGCWVVITHCSQTERK